MLLACVALAGTAPPPIYVSANALGGANWCYNSGTGAGQQGVAGGVGLNNIGLLIRTYGKVTYVDSSTDHKWFYIDYGTGRWDGTQRPDQTQVLGIRVSYGGLASGVPAITPPAVGDKVVVTGIISTCLVPETTGLVQPNVRVRSAGDILTVP